MADLAQLSSKHQLSRYHFWPLSRQKGLLLTLAALLCVLAFVRFNPRFEYHWDDSSYVIAARAYLHGEGFVYANDPLKPPAIDRPLGVPILTTGVFALFGLDHIIAVKIAICILYFLFCFSMYIWLCRQEDFNLSTAFLVALVFGSSVVAIDFSHQVMAEIPYTLCSLLALALCIQSTTRSSNNSYERYIYIIGAALASVASVYFRSIGLSIVIATISFLLFRKVFGLLLLYFVSAATLFAGMIAWLGTTTGNPFGGYSYTTNLADRIGVAIENSWNYCLSFGQVLWPFPFDVAGHVGLHQNMAGSSVLLLIRVGCLILIIAGLPRLWRLNPLFILYGLAYMGVLALWPYVDAGRFLLPVMPLLLVGFVFGCQSASALVMSFVNRRLRTQGQQYGSAAEQNSVEGAPSWVGRFATGALVILAASNFFGHAWQAYANHDNVLENWALQGSTSGYGPGVEEYFNAALWVKDHLPSDLVIASRSPFDFYLWSDHPSIEYGWNGNVPSSIVQALGRADVVVVDDYWPQTEHDLKPMLLQSPERYQLIYTTQGQHPTRIYRIAPAAQS